MSNTPAPAHDAAVSANQQSGDSSAGVDTSRITAAGSHDGRGQGGETAGSAGTSGNSQGRQISQEAVAMEMKIFEVQEQQNCTASMLAPSGSSYSPNIMVQRIHEDEVPVKNDCNLSEPRTMENVSLRRPSGTYEDLGIISQRPKRPDMAGMQTRISTFTGWIHEKTHPKEEMAEAGFHYTGHEDLVRCFHCKGGLKTWEGVDTPWVEHARWFPRCPFIKLCKGQRFINAVQKLNDPKTRPSISQEAIAMEMKSLEVQEQQILKSDVLFNNNTPSQPLHDIPEIAALRIDANVTEASMNEMIERLEEENDYIRRTTLCKKCKTTEVNIMFLPCGHLSACAQCAPAMTTCALCCQPVKGSVRVLRT